MHANCSWFFCIFSHTSYAVIKKSKKINHFVWQATVETNKWRQHQFTIFLKKSYFQLKIKCKHRIAYKLQHMVKLQWIVVDSQSNESSSADSKDWNVWKSIKHCSIYHGKSVKLTDEIMWSSSAVPRRVKNAAKWSCDDKYRPINNFLSSLDIILTPWMCVEGKQRHFFKKKTFGELLCDEDIIWKRDVVAPSSLSPFLIGMHIVNNERREKTFKWH